jgi:hypothetical protein
MLEALCTDIDGLSCFLDAVDWEVELQETVRH